MYTRIAGYILRAEDKKITADFYSRLGLGVREHEHGGPLHFEITESSPDSVVEIYQRTNAVSVDALMIEVDSINDALKIVKEFGILPKTALKETIDMQFIYINDPDGRGVMLLEKKKYM